MTTSGDAAASEDRPPTVRERLRAAGISDERCHDHLRAEAITLDGDVVRDLDQTAPYGTRIVFTAR